jgi:tetraacyldisaccharide 4'-kinase
MISIEYLLNSFFSPVTQRLNFLCKNLFFLLFLPCEYLYRIGFFIDQSIKKYRGQKTGYPFKIISVGNLSVGGTGKSVVVPFLVKLLGSDRCAVVMRGYGGAQERASGALLVSDGNHLFCAVREAGDEAVMHATQLTCPVVVAARRADACHLLKSLRYQSINYVLLDDAYQHHSVKKDIDIVLLDARKPFDNGYCLPAGRLREKDLSRASIIIMTHADRISPEQRSVLQSSLEKKSPATPIFWGRHAVDGLYHNNEQLVTPAAIAKKKCVLVVGIGNPINIQQSLDQLGLAVAACLTFPNHAPYRERDLDFILSEAQGVNAHVVITTTKDWVKLAPFVLQAGSAYARLAWYVLRVCYELLDKEACERLAMLLVS